MEPQTIIPSNEQTPTVPASSPTPHSRKKAPLIIGVLIGLVVLVGAIILVLHLAHKNDKTAGDQLDNLKPGTITGPYVEREHYPRKEIGTGIADATALELMPSMDAVKTLKGAVILPACTLVTQSDLRGMQYWPAANSAPGVMTMSYIDGLGSGPINVSTTDMPAGDDSNECSYAMQDKSHVSIDVFQPYMVPASVIDRELADRYEKASSISGVNGVELYRSGPTAANGNTMTYFVRKSADLSFSIAITGGHDQQASIESLVKTAVKNAGTLVATPQGAPHPTYKNSPTYKQTYLRACSFMGDEGMKAYSGDPAAATVNEEISNSTGAVQYKEQGDSSYYVYVENHCSRFSAAPGGSRLAAKASIDMSTTSYDKEAGAKNAMAFNKKHYATALSAPGLGDEALIFKNSEGENELIMRKGRFIITITPDMLRQQSKGLDNQQAFSNAIKPYVDYVLMQLARS